MPTLQDLLGRKLLGKTGEVETASALAGKEVVGLYFSAHWCGPCRMFTPRLADVYKKLIGEGKELEIVFVSSDRDEGSFDAYYGDMPWLALPYAARDVKQSLSSRYKVRGIPTLVLLAPDGKTLHADGRRVIENDIDGKEFPWPKKGLFEILGSGDGEVMGPDGDSISVGDLKGKKLALYFSAHWCPPCKAFTPMLIETYKALKKTGRDDFEFIFVSSDKSPSEFGSYFQTMPWTAIPPQDKRKSALSELYNVEGIPTLVTVDEEGNTITTEARAACMRDPEGANFPWRLPAVRALDEAGEALNESTAVVLIGHRLPEEKRAAAHAAVKAVAERIIAEAKTTGDDEPPILFAACTGPVGGIAEQVLKLTKMENLADGRAALLILDIPDGGGYYVVEPAEVTEAAVEGMLTDYKAKTLNRQQLA